MLKTKLFKKIFNLFLFVSFFALLTSCYIVETPKTHTITFELDNEVLTTIKVKEGETVKADEVPADPVLEYFVFDGWYCGENKFALTNTYTEDITYVAKFSELLKVNFVLNDEIVKTVRIEKGEKIDILDIPADPTLKAHEFVGWFDGEVKFDEMKRVLKNKTYVAKFEKSHYIVNFINNDETVEVLVGINDTLSLEEIANPTLEDAYFAGWYAGDVCATEGMSLNSDITFEPKFVTLESFNGTWYNEEGQYFIIENGKVVGGEFGKNGKYFTFNVENGTLNYESDGFYLDESKFEITEKGAKFEHKYYDGMYEEFITETYELILAEESVYEGTYRSDNSGIITIIDGGVVTEFDGTTTLQGIIKEVDGQLVISYMTSESYGVETVSVQFDEFGNLHADNVIYVKNPTSFEYKYYAYTHPTVHFFKVNDELVVTVKENNVYYYGTVEGNVALNEIITVNYNEKSLTIKIVGNTSYEVAGEEKGVYTSEKGTITLNGFGDAKVAENGSVENCKYVVNGAGNLVIGEKGYALDLEDKTYQELTKDNVKTNKYIYSENSKYTLTLDGFGGANLYYTSSYSSEYHGKYVLKDNTIIISNCQSYANGTWTVEENGNVLINGSKIYLLEGATFEDVSKEMDGKYGENGSILVNSASKTIKYNDVEYILTYNYNGSKATFEVKHTDSYEGWYEAEFTDVYTISLTEEGNLCVEAKLYTWDEYGEGATFIIETKEYAPYVSNEKDAFAGTWVGKNDFGVTVTIVINGDGTGTYNDEGFTYTISGNKLSFVYNYEDYSLNGDPTTGTLSVAWTYDYMDMPEFKVVNQSQDDNEEENTLDEFAGTWIGKNCYGVTVTIVINGDGTGTYNGDEFTYTVSGNKLSFVYNYEDYSLNGNPATGTLSVAWTYDYTDMEEFDVVKQGQDEDEEEEPTLDAFAGTWGGKNCYGVTVTIVINGDGTGTYNGDEFTYTVSGNKLSFVYNYEDYSLNGNPATGTLSVAWTYDYMDMPEYNVTK